MTSLAQLDQTMLFKGRRSFVLHDDGTLTATYRHIGRVQEYTIEVGKLDLNPRRDRHQATSLLIGLLVFLFAIVGLAWVAAIAQPETGRREEIFGLIGFFFLPVILCAVESIRQSHDLLVFLSASGEDSVIFFADSPTPDVCRAFLEKLKTEIQKHRGGHHANEDLAGQIRKLAALRDEGLLSDEEFAKAKHRLIESGLPAQPAGTAH